MHGTCADRDPFRLYQAAVQNPEWEVRFLRRTYLRLRGGNARALREDFCGTALLAAHWVRRVPGARAVGVDLDGRTLAYARQHTLVGLGERARRVRLIEGDVRAVRGFRPDVVVAFNFSYFVFMDRACLKDYFGRVRRSLAPGGVFFLDIYGGPQAQAVEKIRTRHRGFTYVWDQASFNPITAETVCHIDFEFPDGTCLRRAFTYRWRLWTLPEVRDLLAEAGFKQTDVYWEGTNRATGGGDNRFRPSRKGDDAESWIAYIAAAK